MTVSNSERPASRKEDGSVAFDTGVIFLACAIVASIFQRYAPDAYMVCSNHDVHTLTAPLSFHQSLAA